MEKIGNINVLATIGSEKKEQGIVRINKNGQSYRVKTRENGEVYVSAYTDEVATHDQVRVLVSELCNIYRIKEIDLYTIVIARQGMTLQQLRDAIVEILTKWGNDKYGVPKPADIINYDKAVSGILYSESDANKITYGLLHMFNDPNEVNKMMDTYVENEGRMRPQYDVKFYEIKAKVFVKIGNMYAMNDDAEKSYGKYISYILTCSDARALTPEDKEKIR